MDNNLFQVLLVFLDIILYKVQVQIIKVLVKYQIHMELVPKQLNLLILIEIILII